MDELEFEYEKTLREINSAIRYLKANGCTDLAKWRSESPTEIDKILLKYLSEEELVESDKECVADKIKQLILMRKEIILKHKWFSGNYRISSGGGLDDDDVIRSINSGNGDALGYGD